MLKNAMSLLLCSATVVTSALFVPHYANGFLINMWSLQAVRSLSGIASSRSGIGPAPVEHPREALWRGTYALHYGDIDQSIVILSTRLDQNPGDYLVRNAMGIALDRKGNTTRAVEQWLLAGNIRAILDLGRRSYDAQHYDDALIAFQAVADLMPAQTALGLSLAFWHNGQSAEAETILRRALLQMPAANESTVWRGSLGQMLLGQKRWQDAYAVYHDAIEAAPNDPNAYIGMGRAQYYLRGLEAATASVEVGIVLSPTMSYGYEVMGDLYSIDKRFSEADLWYQEGIAHTPNTARLFAKRVANWLAAADGAKATAIYSDMEIRFPDFMRTRDASSLYLGMAIHYRKVQDKVQAQHAAEKAVAVDPGTVWNWLVMGDIYEWLKRSPDALQAYQRALQIDPTNQTAKQAISRINGK